MRKDLQPSSQSFSVGEAAFPPVENPREQGFVTLPVKVTHYLRS